MPADDSAREQRVRGRPFQKGMSGNPAGRPLGHANRATALLEAISDGDLTAIVARLVKEAKSGNMAAIKILLDRIMPPARARALEIKLPSIADGRARSKAAALGAVLDAMARGQIDPSEADAISGLVEKAADAANNCGGY